MRLIFSLLLLSSFSFAQTQSLPAPQISQSIVVDGQMNESDWQPFLGPQNLTIYNTGGNPISGTQVKAVYNSTHLYLGFTVVDPNIYSTYTSDDANLWDNDDVVEIFIDPDGDGLNYIELQVNANGNVLDLSMTKPWSSGGSGNVAWDLTGIQTAVTIDGTLNNSADTDNSWTCEIAIPFSSLSGFEGALSLPPAINDTWRINFYRYDYDGVTIGVPVELSAWNTVNTGFHEPSNFGEIVFGDVVTSVDDFSSNSVSVFPNPFSDLISIDGGEGLVTQVDIFDQLGNLVLSQNTESTNSIDVSSISSGVYFIKVSGEDLIETKRLVKN